MNLKIAAIRMSRFIFAGLFFASAVHAEVAYKVDHTDVALFESIPDSYLSQIRQMTIQYTGQSHGRQVPRGLELLAAMDSKYSVQMDYEFSNLDNPDALKVERSHYQMPQLPKWKATTSNGDEVYWSTPDGRVWTQGSATQAKSLGQPFTVSIWCWCWDFWKPNWVYDESGTLIDFNDERMTAYLNAISTFNNNSSLSPTVFVYHTSITDEPETDAQGWDITRYNDQIRQAAADNNGVLFDQADIENWNEAGTEQRIDSWNGNNVYLRHTDYDEDVGVAFPDGHTNDALCLRKAKALWVLLAKMSGWDGGGSASNPELYLTKPNGGEQLTAGTQYSIRWTSADISQVSILFSSNNGSTWSTVASNVDAASGSYSWTVPSVASASCRIRLTESASGSVTDTSTGTFTITVPSSAIWGDVDDSDEVTVADALKIATYDIDPGHTSLASILDTILERGDVNADASINSTDALICASYEVYPDNPHNPPRVGNLLSSVPKVALEPVAEALPELTVIPAAGEQVYVSPAISSSSLDLAIGASTIRLSWNPEEFTFVSFDDPSGTVVNSTEVATGSLLFARYNTSGEEHFEFPQITFHSDSPLHNDGFTMEVLSAATAGSFDLLSTEYGTINEPVGVEEDVPGVFTLEQNSPNPFNPETTIRFNTDRAGHVTLDIYNIQGQLMSRLVDDYFTPGQHEVRWDGRSDHNNEVASGIYIYQLRMHGQVAHRQMVLLR